MSLFPESLSIGQSGVIEKDSPSLYDGDPRGILWMWEPPDKRHNYVMGIDPTVGRTGWNRYGRVKEDRKTDNGVIEIVRVGRNNDPDYQVAEYAAPIDAFELGYAANILGRLYAGVEEDQCRCIIEVNPGPGGMTLQTMLGLGYTNHFHWQYYGDYVATPTKAMGWHGSLRTNRDLWAKSCRHISLGNAIVRSEWLREEYADCRWDPIKEYAYNDAGHDDRVRAFNLALWFANSWSVNIERTEEKVREAAGPIDWQYTDMTPDEIKSAWGEFFDRI